MPLPLPRPNPRARVSISAINSGFTLLMQQLSAWIVVTLVMLSVSLALVALALVPMIMFSGGFEEWFKEAAEPWTRPWLLQYLTTLPLSAWVTGALLNVALRQFRGGYVKPEDLFTAGRAFWRILAYSALFVAASMPIAAVSAALSVIVSIVLNARLFLAPVLMVDRNLGVLDSLRVSWDATRGQWFASIVYLILSALSAASGVLLLVIGIVATLPLTYLSHVVVYRRFFPDVPTTTSPDLTDADFRTY